MSGGLNSSFIVFRIKMQTSFTCPSCPLSCVAVCFSSFAGFASFVTHKFHPLGRLGSVFLCLTSSGSLRAVIRFSRSSSSSSSSSSAVVAQTLVAGWEGSAFWGTLFSDLVDVDRFAVLTGGASLVADLLRTAAFEVPVDQSTATLCFSFLSCVSSQAASGDRVVCSASEVDRSFLREPLLLLAVPVDCFVTLTDFEDVYSLVSSSTVVPFDSSVVAATAVDCLFCNRLWAILQSAVRSDVVCSLRATTARCVTVLACVMSVIASDGRPVCLSPSLGCVLACVATSLLTRWFGCWLSDFVDAIVDGWIDVSAVVLVTSS